MPSFPHLFYRRSGYAPAMRLPFALSDGFPLMKNNMGILNTRRFVNVNTIATPTAKEIQSASTISDIASIVAANTNIAKYTFERSKELEKALEKFINIHWWTEMDKNGKAIQRAELIDKDGNTARCRLFGTEKELQREDTKPLASFACGFCKSGGELVTDLQQTPNGLQNVPRIYVNIKQGRE